MRVMALDIGKVRVGVAVSDPAMKVASPVAVLPYQEVITNSRTFRNLLDDWEPELFLSGLPYTMQGEEGPQAQWIREQASAVSRICDVPVVFTDERLSSSQAKKSMREQGMSEKSMRGKIDMVAASLFLQSWMDAGTPGIEELV